MLAESGRCIRSPAAEVKGSYKLLDMGAKDMTEASAKAESTLKHWPV